MFNRNIKIENKFIGDGKPVYIIAEAGVSHFGSLDKAFKLVDMASEASADAIKFQVFNVNEMISKESQVWKNRMASRQLDYESFKKIQNYCSQKKITFFATAHDEPSLNFLVDIKVPVYKIGSGEVGNWPFIKNISNNLKPVIISIGMYKQKQIEKVLKIIESTGNKDIILLHCVTEYPAHPRDIALGNIQFLSKKFKILTGYSDHTEGYHIPLASVPLGAKVIEKHITLDYNIPNAQDWKVSCGPDNLKKFISEVRDVELVLNTRLKPTSNEMNSLKWASKSIVAKRLISKNETLTINDFNFKRPGHGISPSEMNKIIGLKVKRSIQMDAVIKIEDLE